MVKEVTQKISYNGWDEWEAQKYLTEYYAEVMPDERFAMEWLVDSMRNAGPVSLALDFGSGPTVHHLFPLVPQVAEFHLCEYLPNNRTEVEKWLRDEEGAHDWLQFALETLRLEGDTNPTEGAARAREQMVRQRITQVLPGDAGDTDPLGTERRASYSLVTSHYCAEGATNSKEEWQLFMRNIASLVAPAGVFILSACGAAEFYRVGEHCFPCAGVNTHDVLSSLQDLGFTDIDLRLRLVPDHSEQGYGSVIFARAVKGSAVDGN